MNHVTLIPTPASNPFPAEAVATYGSTRITCEGLAYMIEVHDELTSYLTAYARNDARYGGAIGLRGGHGSGKTHVLAWLGDATHNTKSIRSTVLYGKCDSSKLIDLYRQLMEQLDRSLVIELIQLALLNLARDKVRSAKATESLASRLETPGSLQVLEAEHNLDLQQLRQQLLFDLQVNAGPSEVVRIMLDVPNAAIGADAHRWLGGNDVPEPAVLGVSYQLHALQLSGAIDPETSAINAFEIVAALHKLAGVPLVVLVDQLEVLLRPPDPAAFETLSSLLKKFVEQLGRQSALVFVAGIPEAWNKLPRDVPARFRRREPVIVGSLSLAESRIFLESYTHARALTPFPESAVVTIHELSGGSPREVLRIAYEVYERTAGDLATADEHVLLASAQKSGSIADRVRLALTTVDSVLPEFGVLSRELASSDDSIADRGLLNDSGEMIAALIVVKATDALDEIDSVRRVQNLKQYRDKYWHQAELLVVTVGYSSAEVRELLQAAGSPIVFNEKTFEAELRTRLVSLAGKWKESAPPPVSDPVFTQDLAEISMRLQQLENRRAVEAANAERRFFDRAHELSEPMVKERELRTRWEVVEALESLQDALHAGDLSVEQKIMRSILVANESHLHYPGLTKFGEMYVEAIAEDRYGGDKDVDWRRARHDLIRGMRDSLRARGRWQQTQLRYTGWGSLVLFSLFVLTGILSASRYGGFMRVRQLLFLPWPSDFISVLPFVFLGLCLTALSAWVMLFVFAKSRAQRYTMETRALRKRQQSEAERPSLRSRYPQSS